MSKVLCRVIGGGSSVGTAKAADVIKGKTFSNDDDVEVQGTLQGTGTAIEGDVLKGKSFYNTNLQNKMTGTLELTGDASDYDVIQNKGFYSKDPKIKKTGTLPDYPTGTDAQSCALADNYLYYRINKGAYRATWSGDQTEVKYPALSVIAALGIASITSFKVAQYGPNTLRFTWAKPSKGLWSGVHIIGKLNSWPTSPTDGSRSWDSGDTYKDSGSIETGTWYFRAYSYITWTGGRYYSQNPEGSASIYNTTSHGNTTLRGSTRWTVPAGCNYVTAFLVGGGGGLSWPYIPAGRKNIAISGGAAGGYTKTQGFSVTPGEILSITVGAGGTGNGGTSAIYHQNGSLAVSAAGGGSGNVTVLLSASASDMNSHHDAKGGSGGSGGGTGVLYGSSSDYTTYGGNGGYFVEFQRVKYEEFLKNQPIFKKDLNCCADCAKIQGNVILRTRQAGDFYRPAGRHLRKTLKKYYNELGVPQAERPLLPLLADGSEVLWLWGCGFAEGCAPDEYTHEVLTVRTEKTGEA